MELGGFKIATVRGIPVRIHFTFLLVLPLLAWVFARSFREAASMAGVPPEQLSGAPFLWGLGLALALFFSVFLHELAHSLYAARTGARVRSITLLMIGGVSQMEEMPKRPRHEALMAAFGPLVSLGIGALLYALVALVDIPSFNLQFALFYLALLNVVIGLFNLLPAFPMDGGRIMRAVLAPRLGLIRATRVAAAVGKAFAIGFAILGFLSFNMLLLLIAFFVYIGAQGETRSVVVDTLLGRLRVRDIMSANVAVLPADATAYDAAERMLREKRTAFAVVDGGAPLGMVTLEAVRAVPAEARGRT
ncbi:MAG: site-2 protease family protein, partial [Deltaproteobacteria bacterium]|nr:site-2 protease family protein [Kofleriaceae bacterium]